MPAVCLYLDATIDLHKEKSRAPLRGKIGAGDSLQHIYLNFSKILRMHAIFHNAHGFMNSVNNVGPGYVYTITTEKYFGNSMLLGHISGILIWTFMKIFNSHNFDKFPFWEFESVPVAKESDFSAQAKRFENFCVDCHE